MTMLFDRPARAAARFVRATLVAGALLATACPPAVAAAPSGAQIVRLDPAHAHVTIRVYAMGLFPMDGNFGQFAGTLTLDPHAPDTCHVVLDVDVTSLRMSDASAQADALSPEMLDAAAYPRFAFDGNCGGPGLLGVLTLHGESHDLPVTLVRSGAAFEARASLDRRQWGVRGKPLTVGDTVRITDDTTVPPTATGAAAPR